MKITVRDRIAHATTGGGPLATDGPALLLVHGAGMDSTAWHLQTRYLANRGVRALAVDLPGHGASEGDPLTSITDMADWVADFVRAAGLDRDPSGRSAPITVAGHSMGTFVALRLAADHPEMVERVVLLAAADAMGVHPDLLQAAADDLPRAAAMMCDWGHGTAAHLGPNPNPGMWMSGGARALIERSRPGALAADFAACLAFTSATETAAEVQGHVTVVTGLADRMTPPKAAAALTAALDSPTVVSLAGIGHMMMTEAAADIRRILLGAVTAP